MSNDLTKLSSDRASENNQLRTALLDSVTHEFRTPLTSIKAAITALLTDSYARPSERNELLSIINDEADRLNRLVGEALDCSRFDTRVKLDLRPHTILSIINAAKADCRTLLGARLLSIQLDDALPLVRADLHKTKKALVQLLENAIKYSPSDEPITITATSDGTLASVSVIDRGSGIADSEQELILERFYRGKNHQRLVDGTGMGLSIATAIIKAHGGSLKVRSQHNRGSTFSFTLPVYRRSSERGRASNTSC